MATKQRPEVRNPRGIPVLTVAASEKFWERVQSHTTVHIRILVPHKYDSLFENDSGRWILQQHFKNQLDEGLAATLADLLSKGHISSTPEAATWKYVPEADTSRAYAVQMRLVCTHEVAMQFIRLAQKAHDHCIPFHMAGMSAPCRALLVPDKDSLQPFSLRISGLPGGTTKEDVADIMKMAQPTLKVESIQHVEVCHMQNQPIYQAGVFDVNVLARSRPRSFDIKLVGNRTTG
eukprot:CAMPEP_0202908554 /NCGR_PEP_ID=MMETSP1392-20130828/46466_1 /ASSEMBLY_ACC=CAM_ASM_000868 /TAXON_ID=225041 /ORGANISM="Chlamydomonas chlamydogama, Strain SAG 11-48b" /LENGTH=233 /DNA_ID=CAMNT_0049597951 /DNA_START=58 /DNA_END=756 /DNA_ORIENTATION=+